MSEIETDSDLYPENDDDLPWDDNRVLVVPGLPANLTRPSTEEILFPSSAIDFVKLSRAKGIAIEYAVPADERTFVSHYAADIWAPLINHRHWHHQRRRRKSA